MAEYWKSTPSYWCKFCAIYVKDTPIEKRNHESSGKHQNNIQRNLRELHKGQAREERDKKWAKDEVARLNGLVGGKSTDTKTASTAAAGRPVTALQGRKTQAEQLAALGVVLPEALKKEVQGVGSYEVISKTKVASEGGTATIHRSLAEILAETRQQQRINSESHDDSQAEEDGSDRKRKLDEESDEETKPRKKNWGNEIRTYPGTKRDQDGAEDLDALLGGVKKMESELKTEAGNAVKREEHIEETKPLATVPMASTSDNIVPTVMFKKRMGKK